MSQEQRQNLFSGFWDTADFNVQNAYLCGCVKVVDIAKRYTEKGSASRRSHTRNINNGDVSIRVCMVAFLKIYEVSNGRLSRALKAQSASSGSPHSNLHRRHVPNNKTSDDDLLRAKEHIESIPKYQSITPVQIIQINTSSVSTSLLQSCT